MVSGVSLEAYGAAWGRQGGLSRGVRKLDLRLGRALGGCWGHFGPRKVAPATDDGPLGVHFGSFLNSFCYVFAVLRSAFAQNNN